MSDLGALLAQAHGQLRAQLVAVLDGSGLHLGHISILGALAAGEARSQRDLCARTGIEKSSMVLFLDALERQGWVRREPRAADRRAYGVRITPEGAGRLAELGPRLEAVEAAFLEPLTGDERGALRGLLARLVQR